MAEYNPGDSKTAGQRNETAIFIHSRPGAIAEAGHQVPSSLQRRPGTGCRGPLASWLHHETGTGLTAFQRGAHERGASPPDAPLSAAPPRPVRGNPNGLLLRVLSAQPDKMPVMTYVSPFGDMDTDHDWPDALCLSRAHCVNASEETIGEFYEGAVALIEAGIPQPAFFLARQLAELSLKAFAGPGQRDRHDLGKLLKRLQESGDDLFAAGADRRLVVEFIRDLYDRDPGGDQGRYATTMGGALSLAKVCCANPKLFRQHVDRLFLYTQERLSRVGQNA